VRVTDDTDLSALRASNELHACHFNTDYGFPYNGKIKGELNFL